MSIKPIETHYKGYRFRSRLEARWAVYFDALGIEWQYEKEGYDLGPVGWYLPDFWLPQVEMWAEVKPGTFDQQAINKLKALCLATRCSGIMLDGEPRTTNYWGFASFGGELIEEDFIIQEGHRYWESEHRFFASTGSAPPERIGVSGGHAPGCICGWCDLNNAVVMARSARFENNR